MTSNIRIRDNGNHKTSIHLEITNLQNTSMDITAFHKVNEKLTRLRTSFDNTRFINTSTIELEPNETIMLRIAPPESKKYWSTNQRIVIKSEYNGHIDERMYLTGQQQGMGQFIAQKSQGLDVLANHAVKQLSSSTSEIEKISLPIALQSSEPRQVQQMPSQVSKISEPKSQLEVLDLKNIVDNFVSFRTKLDASTKRVSALRETFLANKKRIMDAEVELKKEEDELKDAIQTNEVIEQQFKKIKTTIGEV